MIVRSIRADFNAVNPTGMIKVFEKECQRVFLRLEMS